MLSQSFTYWYSYFDTLFLAKKPTVGYLVYSQLCSNNPWPIANCSLPSLCSIFSMIEQFIVQQRNWKESICTIDELNKIQLDVTNVRILLQIEKMYIINFWAENRRRVQASVAHLYSILQLLIGSIIPYENMTLLECRTANKLCVQLFHLQSLFKRIMNHINPICNYFSNPFFAEQENILRNFFQNLLAFMKLAHQIKKNRMFHISNLLKYITVVNPIEISRMQKKQYISLRSKLIEQSILQQSKNQQKVVSLQKVSKDHHRFDRWIINSSKNWLSCAKLKRNNELDEDQRGNYKLFSFNFPIQIRRHSIKHRKQSLKLNLQSIGNFTKGKSYTEVMRKQSPIEQKKTSRQKKKSISKYVAKHKSSSLTTSSGLNKQSKNHLKISVTSVDNKNQQKKNQIKLYEDNQDEYLDSLKRILILNEEKRKKMEANRQSTFFSLGLLKENNEKIIGFFAKYIIASRISTII